MTELRWASVLHYRLSSISLQLATRNSTLPSNQLQCT